MKLRLLYFARLRERFGVAEERIEFAGATAADLLASCRRAAACGRRNWRRAGRSAWRSTRISSRSMRCCRTVPKSRSFRR